MGSFARLSSTISKQDFNQNVGEVYAVVGLGLGRPEARLKRGPLMTSSYSANH